MTRGKLLLIGLGLAVAAGLAACDEDTKQSVTSAPGAGKLSQAAFCAALAKIEEPLAEAGQYASREQKIEAAKKVTALLDAAVKLAPSDIADAARTRIEAIRTAANGETSELIDSATLEANEKLKTYCPT